MATLLQIREPGRSTGQHEEAAGAAVGIDLGTTNSVVCASTHGKPQVLRDDAGRSLIPSVVAYASDGSPIVGELARRVMLDQPEAVISSVKRLMGRGVDDLKALAGTLPYEIATADPAAAGQAPGMVRVMVAGRTMSPVEISADILRAMREMAEERLSQPVKRAVVTVPAYFDDAARTATRDAARLAGLEVLRLVNEPTAAALAYGLDRAAEGHYAVYDLGGGTFDVSILRMTKGVFQVLATGGDTALGGDDFDHAIAEHMLGERRATFGEETLSVSEVKLTMQAARVAKECLSRQPFGEWSIVVGDRRSLHHIDRALMEALIGPAVDRTTEICRSVIEDAGLTPADIREVILVGGSTRVPLVRERVEAFFGRKPYDEINPDEVVAVGAALQAEALTRGSDQLLLDITPLSLGIETMGGIVEKIIPRNTPIPVARAQVFTTFQDGQTAMSVHVVQGEREMVDQCRSLARFDLRGIPPMVAGAARIRVMFSVDADGLLTVSAKEKTTGVEQKVDVKPSYGLADEDLATMLQDSHRHAAEDIAARSLAEARVDGARVASAVRSALAADSDLLSADEIAAIEAVLTTLDQAIAGGDRDTIRTEIDRLELITQPFAERRMDRGIRAALSGSGLEALEKKLSR